MNTITIIIVLAAVGVLSLILYFALRPSGTKRTVDSLYSEGLRLLLEGELQAAGEKLKAVVKRDTGYVDAYIKLGDIFRERGNPRQALKVHQTLTVRRNLYPGQQLDIRYSLLRDHLALNDTEKALQYADRMLEINKKSIKALQAKLDIYKQQHRWEAAGEILMDIQKYDGKEDPRELALYKVQEGRKLQEQGEGREARIRYRRALKVDPGCCAALYYLGVSYDKEGRIEEAVEQWEAFGEACPDLLYLVSEKMEQRLFELGNFNEIEQFYTRLLKKHPENIEAAEGLAGFYEKKGDVQAAIRSLEEAVDKEPGSLRARLLLAKNYNTKSQNDQVEKQLDTVLKELSRQQSVRANDIFKVE